MNKKYIGYWYSKYEPEYPMPIENSATDDEIHKMLSVYQYFKSEGHEMFCKGSSVCRLCGKLNGSSEFVFKNMVVPEGLKHYIVDHRVKVQDLLDINI